MTKKPDIRLENAVRRAKLATLAERHFMDAVAKLPPPPNGYGYVPGPMRQATDTKTGKQYIEVTIQLKRLS